MLVIQRPTVEALGEPEGDRQRFAISPLEPGFGHTIGNSLRRTLLSSIPGAAVTQVRFDDALHEFGTINGVTEDVTDVILNLKDLVLTSAVDEPVTLRLDVRGPADVTAADIQTTVGCRDPQRRPPHRHPQLEGPARPRHHRGPGPRATCRPTGTRSRPRSGSCRSTRSSRRSAGSPSTSSPPVSRWTRTSTGSCSTSRPTGRSRPREALASAGDTLRSLVALVAEMSDDPQGLELGETATVGAGSPDLDLPIEDLDLSERPRNCLKRAQVNTVGELLRKSEDDLLAITNFGQKSLDEVIAKLDERGLSLRGME